MKEWRRDEVPNQLDRAIDVPAAPVVCLVGPFQCGKTTAVRQWLQRRYEATDPYYLNVNLYLLDQLKNEGPLAELVRVKARARLVMQVYLDDAIRRALTNHPLLVLDAIEILLPYQLDLVSLARKHLQGDRRCIICVPEDNAHDFEFEFNWDACQVVRMVG